MRGKNSRYTNRRKGTRNTCAQRMEQKYRNRNRNRNRQQKNNQNKWTIYKIHNIQNSIQKNRRRRNKHICRREAI